HPPSNKEAESGDMKKVIEQAQKGDAERKAMAGLTMSANSDASPALFKNEVAEAKGDTSNLRLKDPPPPPDIKVYSGKDLDDAALGKEDSHRERGRRGTYAEFPNGVKVDMMKERTTTVTLEGQEPTTHVHPAEVRIEGATEKPAGSGTYVDAANKQVAKQMADGSVRVSTDKGAYNVYPDGHISKETVVGRRNADGTWNTVKTDTPLGDLRPPKF